MKNQDQPAHSKIGASSMHRWAECPGSVALCETVPPSQSSYAEEGSAAHALAEIILKRELRGKKLTAKELQTIADAPDDMSEAVNVYVQYVLERAEGKVAHIEHRFDLSELHPGLFGTADCVIYDEASKHLLVADYKHGAGVKVNPERNVQLMYYGLGALLTLKYPCKTIELAIVQPRCGNADASIRSWEMPSLELIEFGADLVDFAKATEVKDAKLAPGDHCRFCPAQGVCPEIQKQAQALAIKEFSAGKPYEPTDLSKTLEWLPRIEAWTKSVREFAYKEALAGRMPPGWKLVQKRGTRQWTEEPDKMAGILLAMGLAEEDIFETPSLRSVPQLEKRLKNKAERDAVLGKFVKQTSSGATLVEESDPRPSVIVSAEEDFRVDQLS